MHHPKFLPRKRTSTAEQILKGDWNTNIEISPGCITGPLLIQCPFMTIELVFGVGREFLFVLFGFVHFEGRMGMGGR